MGQILAPTNSMDVLPFHNDTFFYYSLHYWTDISGMLMPAALCVTILTVLSY